MVKNLFLGIFCCLFLLSCSEPPQPKLRIATASNFRPALEVLRADFEKSCHCRLEIASGATGMLYSQIREGAPYDIFLAADSERPRLLQRDGLIAPGSYRTYARGRLALWIERSLLRTESGADLPGFVPAAQIAPPHLALLLENWRSKIVIADPQLAPYGDAAVRLLRRLKLWRHLRGQMVYAANVGHAQIILREGHAQLGLIPMSLALASGKGGDYMAIPEDLYPPLEQRMVILKSSRSEALAQQFADYLLAPKTQQRLGELGYFSAASAPVASTPAAGT
ncbi:MULTISPECIES: molybdate ABC transporter substrate-binding protein [unclassified Microbulbifer]|uniref:molybdate ABC transporter substrate-binding protein n=1 Tax=unclassified Microbulbifer TaxID=2619833 RepID=UPI0027E54B29|nr:MULTISPECIES: molybdate ABC transporter substrate-binding protein [unclassified Microbulbifer]